MSKYVELTGTVVTELPADVRIEAEVVYAGPHNPYTSSETHYFRLYVTDERGTRREDITDAVREAAGIGGRDWSTARQCFMYRSGAGQSRAYAGAYLMLQRMDAVSGRSDGMDGSALDRYRIHVDDSFFYRGRRRNS